MKQDLFVQESAPIRTQHGALCWRTRHKQVQVLLVTSRDTGRWVIPKGWPHGDLGPMASAEREAWEEAGVEGKADPRCLGFFSYDKCMAARDSIPCVVSVHALRVQRLVRNFPERKERRRKWFALHKAAKRVAEPELRMLLLSMKSVLPLAEDAVATKALPEGLTPNALSAASAPGAGVNETVVAGMGDAPRAEALAAPPRKTAASGR